MHTIDGLRRTMQSNDWFGSCSPAMQDALLAHGRERRLVQGEHLFTSGAPDGGLYCVLSGSICVYSTDAHDELPVLLVLAPCHWFGELSLIDDFPRSHDAVAESASVVWWVPGAPLKHWLDSNPRHWREMAKLVSGKLRVAFQIFDHEVRSPMTERVARRLHLASLGWGWRSKNPVHRLKLSQDQLARMLGTSRSSVSKSLRELEKAGAIALRYGEIEIADAALLLRICSNAKPAAVSPV